MGGWAGGGLGWGKERGRGPPGSQTLVHGLGSFDCTLLLTVFVICRMRLGGVSA